MVAYNVDDLVTRVHSYVTMDKSKMFCIYDAPTPEAIRRAARRNNLPVDKVMEVRVLDPLSFLIVVDAKRLGLEEYAASPPYRYGHAAPVRGEAAMVAKREDKAVQPIAL